MSPHHGPGVMHCCSATTQQYPYTAIHTASAQHSHNPSPYPLTHDLGTLPDPEGCGLSRPSHQYKPGTCTTVPPGHQNVHETPAHTIVTSTVCTHTQTHSKMKGRGLGICGNCSQGVFWCIVQKLKRTTPSCHTPLDTPPLLWCSPFVWPSCVQKRQHSGEG